MYAPEIKKNGFKSMAWIDVIKTVLSIRTLYMDSEVTFPNTSVARIAM